MAYMLVTGHPLFLSRFAICTMERRVRAHLLLCPGMVCAPCPPSPSATCAQPNDGVHSPTHTQAQMRLRRQEGESKLPTRLSQLEKCHFGQGCAMKCIPERRPAHHSSLVEIPSQSDSRNWMHPSVTMLHTSVAIRPK